MNTGTDKILPDPTHTYGAWIAPTGQVIEVPDYEHDYVAWEIARKEKITANTKERWAYTSALLAAGYARTVNKPDLVYAQFQQPLTYSQTKALARIATNGNRVKRIIRDYSGVSTGEHDITSDIVSESKKP
jgi:hypothetical protein